MGAGASAVKEPNVPLGSTMASREAQGQDLGMEYEVTLLKPKLKDVNLNEKYILRVGYEALVLLKNDETKSPVTYFKYQDIISWGSTNKFFTFKVFGNAMQHHLPVSIIFGTPKGSEIEKITLKSVHSLMADMDRIAVTKTDFKMLRGILTGEKPEVDEVVTSSPSIDKGSSGSGDGKAEVVMIGNHKMKEGSNNSSDRTNDEVIKPGNGDIDLGADESEPSLPLTGEEFLNTVDQFALSRSYTVFQAVQLMELAMANPSLDSFDRMNFTLTLWKSTLNHDSFQLVLNVFDAEEDRENIIARIKDCNIGRVSANLLSPKCTVAGGGIDRGTPVKLK